MNDLSKVLINKAFKDELSHFYIVESAPTQDESYLSNWTLELIKDIRLNQGDSKSSKAISNHIDVLFIKPKNVNYNLEDLNDFFQFMKYKAHEFKRKYVIIEAADKLTAHTSNKLLKTLEEPSINMSIFLLNPKKTKLLDTISSRGIKLRVPVPAEKEKDTAVLSETLTQATNVQDFMALLKKKKPLEIQLQKAIVDKLRLKNVSIELIANIDQYFSEYKIDKEYNHTPLNRQSKLYDIINAMSKA